MTIQVGSKLRCTKTPSSKLSRRPYVGFEAKVVDIRLRPPVSNQRAQTRVKFAEYPDQWFLIGNFSVVDDAKAAKAKAIQAEIADLQRKLETKNSELRRATA